MAWIKGSSYGDDLYGTSYADRIEGFGGDDWIYGYSGNDLLFGGSGDDALIGGSGNDDLDGGTGWDYMEGGTGHDDYFVDSINDGVVEYAGEGVDLVHTNLLRYALQANVEDLTYVGGGNFSGLGNSLANDITGSYGHDILSGYGGSDLLIGGSGNDDLFGGSGGDVLRGGAGLDGLFGGTGNDFLTGGTGADDFYFDTALSRTGNVDAILDFEEGSDAILLDLDVFTRIAGTGELSPGAFVEGTQARDYQDRIVYDQASGNIFYDADGAGAAAKVLFATVTAGTDLIASDFIGY